MYDVYIHKFVLCISHGALFRLLDNLTGIYFYINCTHNCTYVCKYSANCIAYCFDVTVMFLLLLLLWYILGVLNLLSTLNTHHI